MHSRKRCVVQKTDRVERIVGEGFVKVEMSLDKLPRFLVRNCPSPSRPRKKMSSNSLRAVQTLTAKLKW